MKKITSSLILLATVYSCGMFSKGDNNANETKTISNASILKKEIVIDSNMVRKHLYTLAADDMEGRKSGTAGIEKAAVYIENEFKKIGLSTFGDLKITDKLLPLKIEEQKKILPRVILLAF